MIECHNAGAIRDYQMALPRLVPASGTENRPAPHAKDGAATVYLGKLQNA